LPAIREGRRVIIVRDQLEEWMRHAEEAREIPSPKKSKSRPEGVSPEARVGGGSLVRRIAASNIPPPARRRRDVRNQGSTAVNGHSDPSQTR